MLKSERSAFILSYIEQHGSARIRDLAAMLEVSEMSIRRDLTELELSGHVQRVHGGAVARRDKIASTQFPPYVQRIAETAAHLLPEEGVLFLGAGLITRELALHLPRSAQYTILTNSLKVACQVAQQGHHTLHILGGIVEDGDTIQSETRRFPTSGIDWAILETNALNAARGLAHADKASAALLRAVLKVAAQKMALLAPDALGNSGGELVAPIEMLDVLVTGREAPTAVLWDLSEAGLRFVLA